MNVKKNRIDLIPIGGLGNRMLVIASAYEIAKKNKPKKIEPRDNKVVPAASGSGFFVSYNGHIITNHHVIDSCEIVKVSFKGAAVVAKILSSDKKIPLVGVKRYSIFSRPNVLHYGTPLTMERLCPSHPDAMNAAHYGLPVPDAASES